MYMVCIYYFWQWSKARKPIYVIFLPQIISDIAFTYDIHNTHIHIICTIECNDRPIYVRCSSESFRRIRIGCMDAMLFNSAYLEHEIETMSVTNIVLQIFRANVEILQFTCEFCAVCESY